MHNAKKVFIGIGLSMIGFFAYSVSYSPPPPNALKVRANGITDIVRWPNPEHYEQGDIITIPTDNGTMYEAVVVRPVTVDSMPVDDEMVYTANR